MPTEKSHHPSVPHTREARRDQQRRVSNRVLHTRQLSVPSPCCTNQEEQAPTRQSTRHPPSLHGIQPRPPTQRECRKRGVTLIAAPCNQQCSAHSESFTPSRLDQRHPSIMYPQYSLVFMHGRISLLLSLSLSLSLCLAMSVSKGATRSEAPCLRPCSAEG